MSEQPPAGLAAAGPDNQSDGAWRSAALLLIPAIGVAVAILLPWLQDRRAFPDEPFEISVIYRGGDIQYFPLIAQLARGTVTDQTVKEHKGEVLRSFPHATVAPHAACVAMFGPHGFVVADVVVAVGYFLLLVFLLRAVGISRALGTLIALFLALHIPLSFRVFGIVGPIDATFLLVTNLWGMRNPRPFVSELYLVAALATALLLLASDKPTRVSHWLWLALASGLLVQGDLHAAMIFALASPVLLLCVAKRDGLVPMLRACLFAGLVFAAVVSPFVAQRLLEHPDIPVRWGVFEIDRFSRLFSHWHQFLKPVVAIVLVCAVRMSVQAREPQGDAGDPGTRVRRLWLFALALLVASVACKPVSFLVLGKTVQPYHFDDRGNRFISYLVIAFVAIWLDMLLRQLMPRLRLPAGNARARSAAFQAFVLIGLVGFFAYKTLLASGPPIERDHLRGDDYFEHLNAVEPSYRAAFTGLVGYLDEHVPGDAVLASFDHQVFSWWLTFRDGHWYLAEPFVSGLPDREVELRLAVFCKLLGMSTEEYLAFVQRRYVNSFWLGLAKYQASQWHTFAPLDEYTDDQRRAIAESDSNWQKFIPRSELDRLKEHYQSVSMDALGSCDLDVIVLNNVAPEQQWAPPADDWRLVFENDGFRVFRRSGE